MFRQTAAILLLFAFALQVFNRSIIVLDYFVNKTSFAKACENKARPMLHCNGKCQMMKKLKEQEKNEQQVPERKGENKVEVFSSQSFFMALPDKKIIFFKFFSAYHSSFAPQEWCRDIFHPPAIV